MYRWLKRYQKHIGICACWRGLSLKDWESKNKKTDKPSIIIKPEENRGKENTGGLKTILHLGMEAQHTKTFRIQENQFKEEN